MINPSELVEKYPLNYDPKALPRELNRHYIAASEGDVEAMLSAVRVDSLEELFDGIEEDLRFGSKWNFPEELGYDEVREHMLDISQKNRLKPSFIGDGLPVYKVHPIVDAVSAIRNLTTSYTAYQPERSQGTLISHWIYQCLLSQLTGFEAINASLYDRATALFEAICCALRLDGEADTVLLSEGLFPQDLEVVRTLVEGTKVRVEMIPLDPKTGATDLGVLAAKAEELGGRLAAVAFAQVNQWGLLEDVDALTDQVHGLGVLAIASIDPMHLVGGGLKPPTAFGEKGADIIIGEGQHLAIGPNFGGPGLGIFGVRYNEDVKNHVRATPGRFVGKAKDVSGREAYVMVLSTREQHIRKEKATSNICSNQAFLATLAGASMLARGEEGLAEAGLAGVRKVEMFIQKVTRIPGIELVFFDRPCFNEYLIMLPESPAECIKKARKSGLHVGVDMTGRAPKACLKVAFTDVQSGEDCDQLYQFFLDTYGNPSEEGVVLKETPAVLKRKGSVGFEFSYTLEEVEDYYRRLGDLNVSPDSGCFPLGSCTMKYNPYINDWAAGLKGFADVHPQAPVEDVQGSLEILYEIQEYFKKITGLSAVTTQPVAGAQGELVGLKLFQAYHRENGESKRGVVFIPRSAHGTNFATAAMAGVPAGSIVLLEPDVFGRIDLGDLDEKIAQYGDRLMGIMVTNPNTSGIFEKDFRKMADRVHAVGGLVYMDGANMNAIAGWVDLEKLGVDAVHQNLHKTWTIPHGGGGPGDAVVAVSERLSEYLPGYQFKKEGEAYEVFKAKHSIGSFHRHWGNFAHKVRCYAYLRRLGKAGVPRMSAMAVLSARYLLSKLKDKFPILPVGAVGIERMHEFILTLEERDFEAIERVGITRANIVPRVGKLFLDFGFHAPTVAFPEAFGLMVEPTESYTKAELDRFLDVILAVGRIIREKPEYLLKVPHVTPIDRVDEVAANRNLVLHENLISLPEVHKNRIEASALMKLSVKEILEGILRAES